MGKKLSRKQRRKQAKETNKKEMNKMKDTHNYKTTTTTTWSKPKPPCHTGQNKIFTTASGIDVYGGGRNRSGGWWMAPVTVELAIGPDETMRPSNKSLLTGSTIVPDGWSCDQFVGRIDLPKYIIDMDFPDFGVPKVEDYFWYALCDDIHEHGIKSVSTQCAGGHGRTGVQLCILYYLLNDDDVKQSITSASQLIELIRELHCHHAVETDDQQKYIARILDIPVGEIVIEDRYGGYSYGGGWGKAKGATTPTKVATPIGEPVVIPADVWEGTLDEKWSMDSKVEETECECCGHDTYFDSLNECTHCGWSSPDSKEIQLCYTCGKDTPIHHFAHETDDECMTCFARNKSIPYDGMGVQCFSCKQIRYFDFISHKTDDDKFMCLKCDADGGI